MSQISETTGSDDPLKADVQRALAAAFGEEALAWLDDDDSPIDSLVSEGSATTDPGESTNGLGDLLNELGAAIEGSSEVAELDSVTLETEQVDLGPRYVVFEVADQKYAIPVTGVLEIDRCGKVTPLPRTPNWLRGVTNLRGDILSVTDFRELVGVTDQPRSLAIAEKIIVVKSESCNSRTALVVDRVHGIRNLKSENGSLDGLSGPLAGFSDGVAINNNQETTLLLDPDQLLGSSELSAFIEE